jgi:prepilin-type N-terminal cleavage/methylation domain-containing protein
MSARFSKSSFPLALQMLALVGCKPPKQNSNLSEQGLTLIECLVAMVIITITVVAITPPIFLATASRIQSRRAEQANQIAQKEIDRVRGIVERGDYKEENLPAKIGGNPLSSTLPQAAKPDGSKAAAFSSPATCTQKGPTYPLATPVASGNVIPVDVDGDCVAEYAMQVFRTEGCGLTDSTTGLPAPPAAFFLGVRVYAYVDGETLPDLTTDRANLALTTGRRDTGAATRRPLQTIYTQISRSNTSKALDALRECLK